MRRAAPQRPLPRLRVACGGGTGSGTEGIQYEKQAPPRGAHDEQIVRVLGLQIAVDHRGLPVGAHDGATGVVGRLARHHMEQ